MTHKAFTVVIVGGSVAGLTLANILERIGIEYILLEAYPEIAPQVGASIGLAPNGLRILDQLGCYDAIRALISKPVQTSYLRDSNGKPLSTTYGLSHHLVKRHGYPSIFIDRQMLLQALYQNINDKSKIRANKKVVNVTLHASSVEARTKDGDVFTGDILVGADGIHSNVRKEMWRLANALEPGYVPQSEDTAMPCDYKCIFGISVMKEFEPYTAHKVLNNHFSYLILTGPADRVYWFLIVNLGKTFYGKDIPRFTKEDEEMLIKQHWTDRITESFTMGDLYTHRTASVLTALPEYVFQKWHFKRIVTIGDAAHKFEPLSGQGGNNAIETAAALANTLSRLTHERLDGPSEAELHSAFADMQEIRMSRTWDLVRESHSLQRIEAMETPFLKLVAKYFMPRTTQEGQIQTRTSSYLPAIRIEGLDMPKRSHMVPYNDELPYSPRSGGKLTKLVLIGAFSMIYFLARRCLVINAEGIPRSFHGSPLKLSHIGIKKIDARLTKLVFGFSGIASLNKETVIQHAYFVSSLMPVIFDWTVEAYRTGNPRSPTNWPILFGGASVLLGIGEIAPLYYILHLLTVSPEIRMQTSGRLISPMVARALIPAFCAGFLMPTCLMFLPVEDPVLKQSLIAFWQLFPIYIAVFTFVIIAIFKVFLNRSSSSEDIYEEEDLPFLQTGYLLALYSNAILHWCSLAYISLSPIASATRVFWSASYDIFKPINNFWQNDMLLFFATILIWCFYTVILVQRSGYVSSWSATVAALAVLAGQFLIGPGATYAGVMYWREIKTAAQTKMIK